VPDDPSIDALRSAGSHRNTALSGGYISIDGGIGTASVGEVFPREALTFFERLGAV
jgi:hypothetical protein